MSRKNRKKRNKRNKRKTRILRRPDVTRRTGLSRTTIYQRISDGKFPKPISLGGRAVGWIEAEIDEWLDHRIKESRGCVNLWVEREA